MRKLGLILFAVSFVFANAFALDLNISGAGARAKGMGGAFIGVADDVTAVSWIGERATRPGFPTSPCLTASLSTVERE